MAKTVFDAPQFQTEEGAFAYVEAALWPNGPVCPHCDSGKPVGKLAGKTTRPGLYKCYGCRKPFTVRMGTIFESSHLALHLWLQVIHLMCASKKGISTRQIQRMLNCSMKTAWFLSMRIREAMAPADGAGPIGGDGKIVEADETFLTNSPKTRKRPGYQHKVAVLSLVERGGQQRSIVLESAPARPEITRALKKHVHPASTLHTDGAQYYINALLGSKHESVNHSAKEYARKSGETSVHVNTLEGFFSVFKRGMIGTYQNVSPSHLPRYIAEFDFRQNTREKLGINDVSRAAIALQGVKGKRLTYRTTGA
ncbi:MAG TPA: IS1595 family transposase [Rhizomicrobium sp.]|nr:IS1595 family transposase [Rhizomicrobium sp.]